MIDFATLTRPNKPNHYLIAPPGLCDKTVQDEDAPVFGVTPDELFGAVVDALPELGTIQDLQTDADAHRLSAVAVTSFFKFKDDLDIAIQPATGGATLAAYSRSRVGHSDLGKNKSRLMQLLEALKDKVPPAKT